MKKYRSIAFDLDDTLLDTSGLLVPLASQSACEAMISAGLQCDLQTCLQEREALAAGLSHTDVFSQIAHKYGCTHKGQAIHQALEKFYNPTVPSMLPLIENAEENLLRLSEEYTLYLVTMGAPASQTAKIEALGIRKYFKDVFILNGFLGERKYSAFLKIIQREEIPAGQLLSVGNRLSAEIRDAKLIGADTCYFAFGEHIGEKPVLPEDHPDFTIHHHKELVEICGL